MAPKASDRSVTTCRACRRRKVGCDRQRPSCRQCTAGGLTCVYESQRTRSYHFIQETPGGSVSQANRAPSADELDGSPPLAIPEHRITALEARVKNLSNLLSSLQQSSSSGTSPIPPASFQDAPLSSTPSAGYLSQQGGGKVRYVNASSWNAMCRDASEIDEILYSQSIDPSDHDADVAPVDEDISPHVAIGADTVSTTGSTVPVRPEVQKSPNAFASFWDEFPSKDFCDTALKWHFRAYHPLVPLVHVPSFRREYEHFWSFLRDENESRTTLLPFATLILSFLYAGVVACGDQQHLSLPGLSVVETITQLYRLTSRALRLARFPHAPTLDTLRAYLIQQSLQLREEEPLTSLAFIGLSLRVANILGLHRDPKHFPQLDEIESEVRRRVWWQLVHIDMCLAVAAGLPPLIDSWSWDVQPISQLKDELIGTTSGVEYEKDIKEGRRRPDSADNPYDISATSMVSTSGILAASKYRFTSVQRRLLLQLETGSHTTLAQELHLQLDGMGEHLQQAIDRIPDSTKGEVVEAGPDSAYGSSLVLNKWARLLISTYYDQRLCLMTHAVSQAPRSQSPSDVRTQTIESSISFLTKCARLSADFMYRRFQWSWPGNHQPLHALIFLLNEILSTPDSQYADRARNVIDVIFALASENSGLVGSVDAGGESNARVLKKGGSDVWKYLARLRARAWRTRNWDPTNPLSREQATALCQRWSAEAEQSAGHAERMEDAEGATSQPPAMALENLATPAIGFLGTDLFYSEDLDFSNYASATGLFDNEEGSWMEGF